MGLGIGRGVLSRYRSGSIFGVSILGGFYAYYQN